ncbi:MAG: hypothetical protein D6679_03680 [Candidatus Hydrogenedentota bacterium]|nr:MAG: hypothetical protein D6679_03680 [Candidatus Hydrogenedentota bacterium]
MEESLNTPRTAGFRRLVSRFGSMAGAVVGAAFLLAGFLKTLDPESFRASILSFRFVSDTTAFTVSRTLPWVEIVVGLALLLNFLPRGARLISAMLLLVFTTLFLRALFLKIDINCGCFGPSNNPTPAYGVLRNLLLLLLLFVPIPNDAGGSPDP